MMSLPGVLRDRLDQYLGPKDFSTMSRVSQELKARYTSDKLWKPWCIDQDDFLKLSSSTTIHVATEVEEFSPKDKTSRERYAHLYSFSYQCQKVEKATVEDGHIYNTYTSSAIVAFSIGVAFETTRRELEKLDNARFSVADFCVDRTWKFYEDCLSDGANLPPCGVTGFRPYACDTRIFGNYRNYSFLSTVQEWAHKIISDDCKKQRDINKTLCLNTLWSSEDEVSYPRTFKIAIALTVPLIFYNACWDSNRIDTPRTRNINRIAGATIACLGAVAKYSGASAAGPFVMTIGVCYVIKGVVPNETCARVVGGIFGKIRSLAMRVSHMLRRFRPF